MKILNIFILFVLFLNSSNSQSKFDQLLVGHWKSNVVQNINAEIYFYKNSKGKLIWSNGWNYNFKYFLKDSILTIKKNGELTEHIISSLDNKKLKFKFQPTLTITKKLDGSELPTEKIQFLELLEFSRSE